MDGNPRENQEPLFEVVRGFEDLNLVEFPLALLADRSPAGTKSVRFEDTIRDSSTKAEVARRVTISAVDDLGLPTWQDMDVLLVLLALWQRQTGFTDPKLTFSLYEVCKQARLSIGGSNYERIKLSLRRWNATWLRFDHALWRGEKWASEKGCHLISYYELTNCGEELDPHREQYLDWHKVVVESAQANWTKGLDLDFYFSLKFPSSKRLYRFLDKRLHGERTSYTADLVPFCQEKMGFSRGYKPGRYRELLSKAIEELVAKRFLRDVPVAKLFEGERGVYRVNFHRARREAPRKRPVQVTSQLEELLIKKGVTPHVATRLAKQNPEECKRQLEHLEFLLSDGFEPKKGTGAWLNAAIAGEYATPSTMEQREKRRAESQAKAKQLKAAEAAREAEAQAKQDAEERKLDLFLESLGSDSEREKFFEESLRGAFCRRFYLQATADGKQDAVKMYRRIILHEGLRRRGSGEQPEQPALSERLRRPVIRRGSPKRAPGG